MVGKLVAKINENNEEDEISNINKMKAINVNENERNKI